MAILSNPILGRLSDRTTATAGMRRPWMMIGLVGGTLGTLVVAGASNIPVVLLGWCTCQVFINATLAAQAAVLPDQVPTSQRGVVSGVLGLCLPVASVAGTYLVQAFYAFLITYQAYYLLAHVGVDEADVPRRVHLGTLVQSLALVAVSPVAGRLSDWSGRRKAFVIVAASLHAVALFVIASSDGFDGYLAGMTLAGLGFGMYMAVDVALVVDVLPDSGSAAKDLGVLNIAGALPFAVAPGLASAILAWGDGSYGVLYTVAGACALLGATAVVPIKGVR